MIDFPAWEDLTEKQQLESTYSDVFKDVNGFRPRGFDMSVDELKAALDALYKDLEFQIDESLALEKIAIERFTNIVKETMELCNCDQEKAIDYLLDAEDVYGDWDHFCFNYDLPFGYKRSDVQI